MNGSPIPDRAQGTRRGYGWLANPRLPAVAFIQGRRQMVPGWTGLVAELEVIGRRIVEVDGLLTKRSPRVRAYKTSISLNVSPLIAVTDDALACLPSLCRYLG